ncbi:hypothetical protein [Cellulomonas endometrii]|jgi:hypothetical protein|uniref:hypothetical protein n=1 Tax=Cellulomonas endometrii TaxID=3036301 RepID=UPI0024ACE75B|nr:hypothetical protein [Cellulomonas endometrii]
MTEDDRTEPIDGSDRTDRRLPGERPGVNGNPLGASFRDGPRRTPASAGALLTIVPFLVLVAVVVLVAGR